MRFSLLVSAAVAAALLGAPAAIAGEKTIRLSVPGMECASCPYILRQAILAIDGVSAVKTSPEDRSASVTFDDAVTSPEAISRATADFGYSSTVVGGDGS